MDRAPRLLWVNHFAMAPDMGGGTRHFEMGRELAKRGWNVTIAASDFHLHARTYMRRASETDHSERMETLDGVSFVWLWTAPYEKNDSRRAWNWLSFGRSLERWATRAERPDIVMGSTPHLFAALSAWRTARRYRVPFVLEVRDLWPESLGVGSGRRGLGYWGLWLLARFLYRVASRIVVLARGVQHHLEGLGVPAERIVYVPNGADVAAFAEEATQRNGSMRIVYAGAHGPANGLDVVVNAAALLRDEPRVRFVLVGDGPSKAALIVKARAAGLTNLEFLEPVAKAQIPDVLASCDVGLMVLKDVPLFAFGVSPNKLFDYWAAALPVICNVPGEVAEWVREASGGVQAADATASALVQAIHGLLAMPPERRGALGRAGREWVRREHDRALLAARLDAAVRPLATPEAA